MHDFWLSDPMILFRGDKWIEFVPTQSMTTAEALNAVVRFAVYSSVLLYLATRVHTYLVAIPVVALTSIFLFKLFPNGKTLETFLSFGKSLVTREEFTMPTENNPFMNVLLTEIQDNPNREDAAPVSEKYVRDEINQKFKHTNDIYMDTSDIFDQEQAMRTFHTIQSSKIPNDQDAFLKWLAKDLDAPDHSSSFPARGGKRSSEDFLPARGSIRALPSTTCKPSGTEPSRSSR